MKIIGHTNGGVILTASENEVYSLLGLSGRSQSTAPQKLDSGLEINVSGLYSKLRQIDQAPDLVSSIQGKLQQIQQLLESVDPIVRVAKGEAIDG